MHTQSIDDQLHVIIIPYALWHDKVHRQSMKNDQLYIILIPYALWHDKVHRQSIKNDQLYVILIPYMLYDTIKCIDNL